MCTIGAATLTADPCAGIKNSSAPARLAIKATPPAIGTIIRNGRPKIVTCSVTLPGAFITLATAAPKRPVELFGSAPAAFEADGVARFTGSVGDSGFLSSARYDPEGLSGPRCNPLRRLASLALGALLGRDLLFGS